MAGGSREEDLAGASVRLMNFVSENQLEESKRTRGARVEDGTAQRDRSLYEVLQENKDKKDAEFNERIKHRPPKALDEEEMEFLDKLEEKSSIRLSQIHPSGKLRGSISQQEQHPISMLQQLTESVKQSRREYEKQLIHEEERQLQSFQAAVAAQSAFVHEIKETPIAPKIQEQRTSSSARKNPSAKPLGIMIKVKPPAKKAKMDIANSEASVLAGTTSHGDLKELEGYVKTPLVHTDNTESVSKSSLVQYSDESDDE